MTLIDCVMTLIDNFITNSTYSTLLEVSIKMNDSVMALNDIYN